MQKQQDLLTETDWNVLIILDACRAESFRRIVPQAETVRAMDFCTYRWMPKLAGILAERDTLYVSANPVCERELAWKRSHPSIHWVSVWQSAWGRYGPHKMPTVHPANVNQAVRRYVAEHGQPALMVIHYVQPHMPYIGEHSIPYADWGPVARCEFAGDLHGRKHPREAVQKELLTREDVARAYEGNVDLVVPYAQRLAETLQGTVVVTADHGELLGEDGKYGHMAGPRTQLMEVPWWVHVNGAYKAAPIPVEIGEPGMDPEMQAKLEAIGYA